MLQRMPSRRLSRSTRTLASVVALVSFAGCGDDEGRPEAPPFATGGRATAGGNGGGGASAAGGSAPTGGASCTDCGGESGDPPVCGDGTTDFGETCDDGNSVSEDGCTPACSVEAGWVCPLSEPCRPVAGDADCTDACWDGDACLERDSGVTCRCLDERPAECDAVSFRSLLTPEGWSACDARALSGDGTTVTGVCSRVNQDNQELVTIPAVWQLGGGVRGLEEAPEGTVLGAVNADGSVFAGFDAQIRALRFEGDELEVISENGVAWAVDAAGEVVVGNDGTQAFRWDSDAGLTLLEGPDGEIESYAVGVTADGTQIVGLIRDEGRSRAARWNAAGEAAYLPVPDDTTDSEAIAISEDGLVVVGTLWIEDEPRAVRWTADDYELLSGATPSTARAISVDGTRIVGSAGNEPGTWDEAGAFESLRDALAGANLESWTFTRVAGVSADGSVVAGTAVYLGEGQPAYEPRAFIAVLP